MGTCLACLPADTRPNLRHARSLNLLLTAAPESISSAADASTKLLAWDDGMPQMKTGRGGRGAEAVRKAPDAMGDLRLGDVCDMLYGGPPAVPMCSPERR